MEILEVFKKYVSTEKDVRRKMLAHGTVNPGLRQIPLAEVKEELVPKLVMNWIVHKGLKHVKYKVYFKIWENHVKKTKIVGDIRFKKRDDNSIIVCRVRQDVLPVNNEMYKWTKGLTYEGLSKYELNKSMKSLRNHDQCNKVDTMKINSLHF